MRLLFVTPRLPYLPCHDAARLVASSLLARLVERHTVAVVAATSRVDTPAQRAWLAERAARVDIVRLEGWRPTWSPRRSDSVGPLAALVESVAVRFAPDVIHVEGPRLAPLAYGARVPTVLAAHESGVLRAADVRRAGGTPWRRLAGRVRERAEAAWARTWYGAATACVVDSEDDRQALAEHVPLERIDVIPPGIDHVAHAYRRGGEPWRLVFTGDLAAPRDVHAAQRLACQILPRVRRRTPRAELLLAAPGRVAATVRALAELPGVRVTGALADLRASVRSAAVYVSPLTAGFGRAARLLEPMALGTPVVASRASLAAIPEALAGHHALVADDDDQFADAISRLLHERVVANTIARNARELVDRRLTWGTVAERYEALYARLAPARALEAAA